MTEMYKSRWDEIGLSDDFIFGKVMQKPKLCKKLLQMILPELDIDYIEYPEWKKEFRPDMDTKGIRVDVDQMKKGLSYKSLSDSYIIFICMTDIFKLGLHKYTFVNTCIEKSDLHLGDGAVKIFLNARGIIDDVSSDLMAFLNYLKGIKSENTYVKELDEAVKEAKMNSTWRDEYMRLEVRDWEKRQEGIEIGRSQGIEIGRNEGSYLERQKIIGEMLAQGFSEEQIKAVCKATDEEIEAAKKQ